MQELYVEYFVSLTNFTTVLDIGGGILPHVDGWSLLSSYRAVELVNNQLLDKAWVD